MLIYPEAYDRQPLELAWRDIDEPITKSLVSLWLPGSPNLVNGAANTITSLTGLTRGAGKLGIADVLAGGTSSSYGYGVTLPSTQQISLMIVADGGAWTAAFENRVLGNGSLELIPNASTVDIYISGTNRFSITLATGWTGVFIYTHDLSSSSNVPLAWLDGAPLSITGPSGTPATPTLSGATSVCNHSDPVSLPRQLKGKMSAIALWSRTLTAAEVGLLPWTLYGRLTDPNAFTSAAVATIFRRGLTARSGSRV